jgi:hypothetical protein
LNAEARGATVPLLVTVWLKKASWLAYRFSTAWRRLNEDLGDHFARFATF